jgi:outer membrane receptor protein involved in Fe transport
MASMRLPAVLLGGAGALVISAAVLAQTAQSATTEPALSEVVVTGSRVISNGNNSPTPVTVVQAEELMQLQPTTVNDALAYLPVFQGSRGQFSQPNTTGLYGGGNPATTELNLRNLGPQRTLILFDGQRVAPTNALGIVDADMVPQELIQRVDVVTGGVSAVYGSDAIAGVVNYITDKNFNGFKAEANYGLSDRDDDQSWKAGFAAGTRIGSNGHLELSYDHYETKGLPHRNERGYYLYNLLGGTPGQSGLGSPANPYVLFNNVHNAQSSYGGLVTNGSLKGQQFAIDSLLSAFNHGAATGSTNMEVGGDGTIGGLNSLAAPVTFDQLFLRFDYDLTDTVHFHTEATGNWKVDTTYSNPTNFNNQTFSTSNAFLPAAVKAAMGAATTFTMSKSYSQIPLLTQISNVRNKFINLGLDGKLGQADWGVDVNYSNNYINDVYKNNINGQKLSAALDAVPNAAGQIVCNASLTNAAYSDCVPYNPFGPTAANPAAIAYVTETTHLQPKFTQEEASGHLDSDLFEMPAGAVRGSVSAEWRKQTFSQNADALPTAYNYCTGGIRFNCSATTSTTPMATYQIAFAYGPPQSQSVKEGAVEFDAPLLKDVPFIKSLNLNGAARYTSYDVGGKAWTWKVGLDWHVNDDVRVRATQSRDIEAPTLGMVYQPLLVAFVNNTDTLTNQSPQVPASNTGTRDVVSEVGHTTTAGIVWEPHFLPGFSMSVDGYHIIIDGALIQVQGQSPATQSVCYASKGTSAYCALQMRPGCFDPTNPACTAAANQVTGWIDVFQNVSKIETYGADVELNYATRMFEHALKARLLTTWQPHYLFAQPGAPTYDFGNVAYPNLVPLQAVPAVQMTATLDFALTDKLFFDIAERWRTAMQLEPDGITCALPAPATGAPPPCVFPKGPSAYYTTNINLIYQYGSAGNDLYFNVRNVFDKLAQPLVGLSANSGFALTDDPVGRYYTVGIHVRM